MIWALIESAFHAVIENRGWLIVFFAFAVLAIGGGIMAALLD
jgi:hypothetical protein